MQLFSYNKRINLYMTEHQIITSVSQYFSIHGYKVVRLHTKFLSQGVKCPDLEGFFNDDHSFYCEIKSPLLKANDITKMFHWTTSVTKLRDNIHKAVSQFRDKDPQHESPWVLVFTSDHMQLNWSNLTHAFAGKVYFNNKVVTDLTHLQRVKETNAAVKQVDLFVWLQMNENADIYQVRLLIQPQTKFMVEIKDIAHKLEPLPTDMSYKR